MHVGGGFCQTRSSSLIFLPFFLPIFFSFSVSRQVVYYTRDSMYDGLMQVGVWPNGMLGAHAVALFLEDSRY